MNKIKSEGSQAFNVPATDEGKEFVKLLRKFSNRPDCRISVRGRGKRAVNGQSARHYASHVPLGFSEWFAVYVRSLKNDKNNRETLRAEWKRYAIDKLRIEGLEEQVKGLKIALVESQERYNALSQQSFQAYKGLKQEQKIRLDKSGPALPALPVNPPVGTVTISVKGAHIRIVQEQE